MPQFLFTITFGNLLEICSLAGVLISLYYAAVGRVRDLETTLRHHAEDLSEHAARLDRFSETLVEVMGDVQRIMGRMESVESHRRQTH